MPAAALVATLLFAWGIPGPDPLALQFKAPPPEARPWVYWFIMDGNFSREGITADLEAMQRAGIGGVVLMEVDVGIPRGPVRFMSSEWRGLFRHAVSEAERLGLEITLNAGPGWTGSGGPWVKPDQSMQHLVAASVDVTGPSRFSGALPRPAPRPPYFGEKGLPPELIETMRNFYVDVAVLAVPAAAAGLVPDLDEKALYVRHPYSSRPGTKPFLPEPPGPDAAAPAAAIKRARVIDLTGRLQSDGSIDWEVPAGRWTILRFGRASSGANTRPAPQPGLGLECDKFDRSALDAHFKDFVGVLMGDLGPRPAVRKRGWTMLHIDSWEMGAQNWSAGFRDEFRRRRGYDPLPFLPAFTGRIVESLELTERFLWDLRITAQELVVANHATHLRALAHANGFGLSIEPYDMNPCADLALGAIADVPMCEFWAAGDGFETTFSCVEAVSIAHTHGRPIVAAEAFTGRGRSSWERHPGSMKNQADWALCAGINRIVFHRYAHQPWLDRAPGMTMGPYGTQYERTQTWWEFSGPWHEYLARCQFLLRRGLPVADVLFLTPEGAPHVFRPPASALAGSQAMPDRRGYNFDACDPGTLMARASVKEGRIAFPDGMTYRVLVLPEVEAMTPQLLSKIRSLVEGGAVVIGNRPGRSPSLEGYPRCDDEVRRIAGALWGPGPAPAPSQRRKVGRGFLVVPPPRSQAPEGPSAPAMPVLYGDYAGAESLLAELGVPPDFASDAVLRYIHRREGDIDLYFVSNPAGQPVAADCTFRVSGKQAELWDPLTGQASIGIDAAAVHGGMRLRLSLEAHGSIFVVFRPAGPSTAGRAAREPMSPVLHAAAEIAGPWEVRFQKGRGAPEAIRLPGLMDLSGHTEESVRYFSGTATYRTAFAPPQAALKDGARYWIDLGRVEVAARVKLNGSVLGIAWRAPYRLPVAEPLRPDSNELEIEVANSWQNRLIGDLSLPPDMRVAWTTRNPFKKDSPLPSSGLIGPVTLLGSR